MDPEQQPDEAASEEVEEPEIDLFAEWVRGRFDVIEGALRRHGIEVEKSQ